MADNPPDRLSNDPDSPYYDEALLGAASAFVLPALRKPTSRNIA